MAFGFGQIPQQPIDPLTGLPIGMQPQGQFAESFGMPTDPSTGRTYVPPAPSAADPMVQRSMLAPFGSLRSGQPVAAMPGAIYEPLAAGAGLYDDFVNKGARVDSDTAGKSLEAVTSAMGGGILAGASRAPGEAVLGAGFIRPTMPEKDLKKLILKNPIKGAVADMEPVFDRSMLHEIPKVEQFALPRYDPPRGVSARMQDLVANKDARDKTMQYIQAGTKMMGPEWYNTTPMREAWIQELGPREGSESFKTFMEMMAATSPRSDVGTNFRNASYYYQLARNGKQMPDPDNSKNPYPYGHLAQRLHKQNANTVDWGGWDVIKNPKPPSYSQNLMGNYIPGTMDTHALRLAAMNTRDPRYLVTDYQATKDSPKINIQEKVLKGEMSMDDALKEGAYWQAQPNANEYGALEGFWGGMADEMGMPMAQTQASGWVGGGGLTGLETEGGIPFVGFGSDRVNYTAKLLNMDPKDVLKRLIHGDMPVLGLGGAAVMAPGLLQREEQR